MRTTTSIVPPERSAFPGSKSRGNVVRGPWLGAFSALGRTLKLLVALLVFLLICSGFYNAWFVGRRTEALKDPALPKGDLQQAPRIAGFAS